MYLCNFICLQVVDLVEVLCVSSLDLLRSLNLRGNPLRELPDYRLSVIFATQQLTELDTQRVEISEKVEHITLMNTLTTVTVAFSSFSCNVYNNDYDYNN